MAQERIGKITYISSGDFGLAHVLEEGLSGQVFPFSFNKIDGYSGEDPKDLIQFSPKGFREGVLIKFSLGIDSKVCLVQPLIFLR